MGDFEVAENRKSFEELIVELENCQDRENLNFEFRGSDGDIMIEAARALGQFYKQKGVLSTGECTVCAKADLVGEFVGVSLVKVNEMIQKATGGVLYVENLFELGEEGHSGLEALDTLLVAMNAFRKDLVIVGAGNAEEMEKFMKKYPGFISRIPQQNVICFE